ncbi:hypothetical protein K466DRAFT_9811 [Polyporus arcularius HHB13444]|uniref:Rpr2-domain-containing protein n=1 Tax=Polyporus arcularius HHB13444 TaxID=1314778 RepID=A0A5C3PUK7_9APHY|nr:hypothetical protein K466DRAFT_9811 [Polyporus arcularius HHB13444]
MAASLPATPNPATAQFQLAVPSLLATISPSLAALHATRARLLHPQAHPTLAGTHCARCGYPLLASDSQTRSIRKKRRGPSTPRRVLRRSCGSCGHDEDVPLAVDDAPTFPKVRDRVKRKSPSTAPSQPRASRASPAELSSPSPLPVPLIPRSSQPIARSSQSTPIPSRPGPPARATTKAARSLTSSPAPSSSASQAQDQTRTKARPKKPGLQSMLARNRERQEQEKKRGEGSSRQGLSAFLQGL